jgi:MFS family permease
MVNKKDISILIGNALDRFDSSLYNFCAPVIGPLFFPHHTYIVQLILAYSLSAVSIMTRPLGLLLVGILVRRYGPATCLSYSLMGVGAMSLLTGLLPDYSIIGLYAPLLLIMVRFVRQFSSAIESTIAKLCIMDDKNEQAALQASYWYQTSSMIGIIGASGVASVLLTFAPVYWRVCFIVGGLMGLYGVYARLTICSAKPAVTVGSNTIGKEITQLLSVIIEQRKKIISVALVVSVSHITYTIPFVFLNVFIPLITQITVADMMFFNTALLVVDAFLIPIIGACNKWCKSTRSMRYAATVLAVTIVPLFYFLPSASLLYVMVVRVWIVAWGIIFLCPLPFWARNVVQKTDDSYFIVGAGYALSAATVGSITPPLCLWLWYSTQLVWVPALYCAIVMALAALVIHREDV